jgi:AP endonuclease 2
LSARDSNYGTRIDYILVTSNLLPWIKFSDIQPKIKGSDHCPVYVDFHDEREIDGRLVKLRDILASSQPSSENVATNTLQTVIPKRDPPRLAARFWDEYSGKQRVLDSFFKGAAVKKQITKEKSMTISIADSLPGTNQIPAVGSSTAHLSNMVAAPAFAEVEGGISTLKRPRSPSSDLDTTETTPIIVQSSSNSSQTGPITAALPQSKPSYAQDSKLSCDDREDKKPKKLKAGQAKLSSFFAAPSAQKGKGKQESSTNNGKGKRRDTERKVKSRPEASEHVPVDLTVVDIDMDDAISIPPSTDPATDKTSQEDGDYRLALALSQESIAESSPSSSPPPTPSASEERTKKQKLRSSNADSGAAWKTLLTKPPPPRCTVHNEEAKEFKVNKAGPNKGRSFWVCSR